MAERSGDMTTRPAPGRRALLHIGTPKTGTSAIQSAFRGYDDGRVAASSLPERHVPSFAWLFSPKKSQTWLREQYGIAPDNLCLLRENARSYFDADCARHDRDILWSCETLTRPAIAETAAPKLADALARDFNRIEAVAYIRAPDQRALATLQQGLLMGQLASSILGYWPGYRAGLAPWIMRADAVHLRLYDRAHFNGGDVTSDFAAVLGLRSPASGPVLNRGMGAETTALLYLLRRFRPDLFATTAGRKAVASLEDHLGKAPPTPLRLSRKAAHRLWEANKADALWISERVPGLTAVSVHSGKGFEIDDLDDLVTLAVSCAADRLGSLPLSRRNIADPVERCLDAMATFVQRHIDLQDDPDADRPSPSLISLAGPSVRAWRRRIGVLRPEATEPENPPELCVVLTYAAMQTPGRRVALASLASRVAIELLVLTGPQNPPGCDVIHPDIRWHPLVTSATTPGDVLAQAAKNTACDWLLFCRDAPLPPADWVAEALDDACGADICVTSGDPVWGIALNQMLVRRDRITGLLDEAARVCDETGLAYHLLGGIATAACGQDPDQKLRTTDPSSPRFGRAPAGLWAKFDPRDIPVDSDRLLQIASRCGGTDTHAGRLLQQWLTCLPHPGPAGENDMAEAARRARLGWAFRLLASASAPRLAGIEHQPLRAAPPSLTRLADTDICRINWQPNVIPAPRHLNLVGPNSNVGPLPYAIWRNHLLIILQNSMLERALCGGNGPLRMIVPSPEGGIAGQALLTIKRQDSDILVTGVRMPFQ